MIDLVRRGVVEYWCRRTGQRCPSDTSCMLECQNKCQTFEDWWAMRTQYGTENKDLARDAWFAAAAAYNRNPYPWDKK